MDVQLRAPRRDEAEQIAAMINAHNRRLWGVDGVTTEIVEHWFTTPGLDTERDFIVAEDAEGRLVGYGDLKDSGSRFDLDLRLLNAAGHEAGMELLARLEARAREQAEPGAIVRATFSAPDRPTRRVFASSGYELVRHSLRMERSLDGDDGEIGGPEWPEGITVRTVDDSMLEPLWRAVEEGFADHWGYQPHPYEEFLHWAHGPNRDPALWFAAMDGDEIAGACLCATAEWGAPDTGHVDSLSVRPPWRRRGLALALLLHSFAALKERGRPAVSLFVDSENTTGAVRLYERAGMRMTRRYDTVDKALVTEGQASA